MSITVILQSMVVAVFDIIVWPELLRHLGLLPFAGIFVVALVAAVTDFIRKDTADETDLDHAVVRSDNSPRPMAVQNQRLRALIIGSGSVARALAHNLEEDGYEVVGFVDDHHGQEECDNTLLLGGRATTSAIVREHAIDAVFLVHAPSWQQHLAETLVAEYPDIKVNIVPCFQEALMRLNRVESCGDIALVRLTSVTEYYADAAKRIFDLTAAMLGLMLTSPLLLIVAALIKLNSKGPVLFTQERVGRFGKPFLLYKFRTMIPDAEAATGPVLAEGKQDARLTPFGRWLRLFRVDEIPQLWNVLRGEMSMVGPRPERPFFVEQFQRRLATYSKRHEVRPGITGLAQVYAGYHTAAEDKLRFDLIYVSQQSLWLDLSILLRTVLVVCKPHR